MSKQVVLLALAGMMLLALALGAQTGDKAETLKRHQSKYGAPKHSNKKYNYKSPEQKEYTPEPPKYAEKEPYYKTHGEYHAPEGPKYPQYTIEEYNKVGDYYGSETDGYYNSDEEYYSDAYDHSRYYTNWCTGTSLKDSLVNALWRFEDLHLYKHAVMSLSAADWASFNVNQTSELTIFAPCNEAMKHVPQIFGLDNLSEFFMDEAALKQYIASTITTEGAFKTWELTNGLELDTLDLASGNTTVSISLEGHEGYGGGWDHEIIVTTNAHMNRARVIRPSNIRVCKSIVHTISHALWPKTS